MRFADRSRAGRALAERLRELRRDGGLPDPVIVLGLPRGGVPVAAEIARALGAPLDVLVARKIGAPAEPEFAIGALAGDDPPFFDLSAVAALGLGPPTLAALADRERAEVRRREAGYRQGRPAPVLASHSVVVVDDGLATGATARVALRSARAAGPGRLVLAVPVGSARAADALRAEADEVVCLGTPAAFESVGQWYDDFGQLTDAEVVAVLAAARQR